MRYEECKALLTGNSKARPIVKLNMAGLLSKPEPQKGYYTSMRGEITKVGKTGWVTVRWNKPRLSNGRERYIEIEHSTNLIQAALPIKVY
jgi:hypothetical protein